MRKGNPRILFHTKEQVRVGPLHGVPEQEGKDTMNSANTFLEKKITESSTVWQKQRPPMCKKTKSKERAPRMLRIIEKLKLSNKVFKKPK